MGLLQAIRERRLVNDEKEIREDINLVRQDLLQNTHTDSNERNIVGQILHISNEIIDILKETDRKTRNKESIEKNKLQIKRYLVELKILIYKHQEIDLKLMRHLTKLDTIINRIYSLTKDAEYKLERLAA